MSEAITQSAAYDLIDRFLRNNLYDDDYAKYSEALEALSQPAPSPQPAVPVVSDEQIRKTVESIQDPDTVPAFRNGYYTLTPDELRRAILSLRPADHPDTQRCIKARNDLNATLHGEGALIDDLEHAVANACAKLRRPAVDPMTPEQIESMARKHAGDPSCSGAWGSTFEFVPSELLAFTHEAQGITAKAEDAHQPTKEAEKP